MHPTARGLPTTLRTTRLLLLGSSGEPHRPRTRLRASCAALRQPAPPGSSRRQLRGHANGSKRRQPPEPATHRPRPAGRHPLPHQSGCPPGTTATASRLGPFHGHAPGGRRTALSRGQRPLSPFPRGDRAWGAPARPRPPARRGREARRGSGGQGPGQDSRGRQRAPSGRPTGRAAPPTLSRDAALASSQWRETAEHSPGRGGERSAARRSAATEARRPGSRPASPHRGDPPPRAVSPRSRRGRPFRGRQAGYGRPHRGLHRDRTAERRGQRDPSPARLPAG